jgi:hypothetical protein
MGLLDSLGLDDVNADPNALPDGKYGAQVFKAGVVATKTDKVQIIVTYKVNDGGKMHGREKPEFFTLGEGVKKDESGKIVGFEKPAMSEQQKPYFKKRMIDLGIPESKHNDIDDEMLKGLIGTDVYFGVKNNNGYCNINFVERKQAGQDVMQGVGTADPFTPQTAATQTPGGSGAGSISDL